MTLVDEQGSRYEGCLFKEIRFKTVAPTLYRHTHTRARAHPHPCTYRNAYLVPGSSPVTVASRPPPASTRSVAHSPGCWPWARGRYSSSQKKHSGSCRGGKG